MSPMNSPRVHEQSTQSLCGARTRSGQPCRARPVSGRERCRMHGGSSPRGRAHPSFRSGRYSRDLPTALAARLAEAEADERLVELRDEIALVDVLLGQVVKAAGEGVDVLAQLRAIVAAVHEVAAVRGTDDEDAAVARLLAAASGSAAGVDAWGSALALVERRRRLVQTEARRLAELDQMITVERALTLVSAVAAVVVSHIADRRVIDAIQRDLGLLLERERLAPGTSDGASE